VCLARGEGHGCRGRWAVQEDVPEHLLVRCAVGDRGLWRELDEGRAVSGRSGLDGLGRGGQGRGGGRVVAVAGGQRAQQGLAGSQQGWGWKGRCQRDARQDTNSCIHLGSYQTTRS